jgi:hypothetical protein
MLSNHSNAHSLPTYPICSLPITQTSLSLSFYLNLYVSIYILLSRYNKIMRPMMRSVPSSSWCTSEPYVCSEKYKFKIIIIYLKDCQDTKLETNNIIFPSPPLHFPSGTVLSVVVTKILHTVLVSLHVPNVQLTSS